MRLLQLDTLLVVQTGDKLNASGSHLAADFGAGLSAPQHPKSSRKQKFKRSVTNSPLQRVASCASINQEHCQSPYRCPGLQSAHVTAAMHKACAAFLKNRFSETLVRPFTQFCGFQRLWQIV
jgi:hypothetical protein